MSWFHHYSSSSSTHHVHEVRSVHSYDPFLDDDEGDLYCYGGAGGEDVKPVKRSRPRGGGSGSRSRSVSSSSATRQAHEVCSVHSYYPYSDDDEGDTKPPAVTSFRSTLRTQESLASLRDRYSIPEGFGLHPAGAAHASCAKRGRGGAVPICVYAQALQAGMRLPLHPFVCDALAHFGIAPSQLAPNGWRVLVGFAVLCHFRQVGAPSLPVFRHFFTLALLPKGKGWYNFRARECVPALFTGLPPSTKAWKEEFLFVSPPPGAPWRCPVRWGSPSKEATSDPVLTDWDAAVAWQLAEGQDVVDLRTFLSESNLVAAKISSTPACLGSTDASLGLSVAARKKRKADAGVGGNGGDVLQSELQAKEWALAKAQGKISRLKQELGNAKTRELAEARQALSYERKLGLQVSSGCRCSKGAGAGKKRRGDH